MSLNDIVYLLRRIRDELDDRKWGSRRYTEGNEMYHDVRDMVETLDILIPELEKHQ